MTQIRLKHAIIERDGALTVTTFADGAKSFSVNAEDDRQKEIARWVGCGDDLHRYNFEHEFIHSFISEKMHDAPSYVVRMDSLGKRMSTVGALFEERWCYHFHCYLNDVKGPVEPEWVEWREEAKRLLGRV